MKEMFITEEELEYYSNPAYVVNEASVPYKSQLSFEEAVKACNGITIDEFSRRIGEAIKRLIPNP